MVEFVIPNGKMSSLNMVDIDSLTVEYNPKRYELYKSLFPAKCDDVLGLKISPMYRFILEYVKCATTGTKFDYVDTDYYRMQRLYGKSHPVAVFKAANFMKLFNNIRIKGITKPPVVIAQEGRSFSIKDGHHRIVCWAILGNKQVVCQVMRNNNATLHAHT